MSEERAQHLGVWGDEFGRTLSKVRCTCGHESMFYRWSWAGNGKARCKGCGRWILYWAYSIAGPLIIDPEEKP
jgi:hypothetical protein